MYNCVYCDYTTNRKLNFERHNISKKHIKNMKLSTENNIVNINQSQDKSYSKVLINTIHNGYKVIDYEKPLSVRIFSMICEVLSYGTFDVKLLIDNDAKNKIKVENYTIVYLYNVVDNQELFSLKISQISSITTDLDNAFESTFLKDYSTNLSYRTNKIDDKKIEIDLDLIYELDHWKNDSKIHINYEIRHFGMQSVKIIN